MPIVNYVREHMRFIEYASDEGLSSGERLVWYALMHIINGRAQGSIWPEGFIRIANDRLLALCPMQLGAVIMARNSLKQRGLIDFIPGSRNKRAPAYKINFFSPEFPPDSPGKAGKVQSYCENRSNYNNNMGSNYDNNIGGKVTENIKKRMDEKEDALIAKQDEVLKYLTAVMRREMKESVVVTCMEEKTEVVPGEGGSKPTRRTTKKEEPKVVEIPARLCDANKAAELLGKRYGLFTDRVDVSGSLPVILAGEDALDD